MGDDLAAMRVQTRFATREAVIESVGASLTRGSLRVPVQITAKQPFDVVLETSTGAEAVRGSAEVIEHAGDATWIRFLSAADNQGDDARWILSDVSVVLQGSTDRKVPTEQFEAITAVNSEQQAVDAIRAGTADPVPVEPLAPLMQVPVMIPRAPILPPKPPTEALKTKLDRRFDLSTGEAAPLEVAELLKASGLAPKVELAAVIVNVAPTSDVVAPKGELALGSGIVPKVERATTNGDDLAIPVEPVATAPTVAVDTAENVLEQASTQPIGIVVAARLANAEAAVRVRPPTIPQPTEPRPESTTTPPPVANTPTAHAETQPLPVLRQLAEALDMKTKENAPLVAATVEDPSIPLDGAPKAIITEDAEPMVMEPEGSTRPTEQQEPLRIEIKSDAMKPLAMPLGASSTVVLDAAVDQATVPAPIPRTPVAAITAGLDLDPTRPNEMKAESDAKRPHVTDQIARERGIRPITSPPRRAPLHPRQILIGAAAVAGACLVATVSTIVWARGAVGDARAEAARARGLASTVAATDASSPAVAATAKDAIAPTVTAAAGVAPTMSATAGVAPTMAAPPTAAGAIVPMTATTTRVEPSEPAPAAHVDCSLSVAANIKGSTVYVDGTSRGPAPAEIAAACDVPVLVEVRRARYETFKSTVTPSGGTLEIAATLEREKTAVTVTSDPPAQVVYNGKVLGTTPLVAKVPRYEQSTLYFRAKGRAEDWRRILPKTPTKTLSVALKKK